MAVTSEEVKVEGERFRVRPFTGRAGLRLQARVSKIIGPMLRELAQFEESGNKSDDSIFKAAGAAAATFLERVDDETIDLMIDLVQNTEHLRRDGEATPLTEQYLDELLPGQYELHFRLVMEVIKVNNFFAVRRFQDIVQRGLEAAKHKLENSDEPSSD